MARVTRASAARAAAAKSPPATAPEPAQLSSPPATPSPRKASSAARNGARKRGRTATVKEEEQADEAELPHNLGRIPDLTPPEVKDKDHPPAKKPRKSRRTSKSAESGKDDVEDLFDKALATPKASPTKGNNSARGPSAKKEKNNSYGLTPGQTPYPDWPHPTPEECKEVVRLLSSIHGDVKPPKTIPAPSLTVSGCGEVPSVLDALIRTRLSAATSGANSSRAFAGLVAKFGILQDGIGKGSVDWNKVRQADTKDIFDAIKSGGLADVKSKDIKKILQMVWEENQTRRKELTSSGKAPGSSQESSDEKDAEVLKAQENVLSLDHLHLLSNDDAFNALTKYPGIGPKTASCVLLFCLQRPSFAVDTHVFRLCTWLGWVPPPGDPAGLPIGSKSKGKFTGPTRNSTYAHCEVMIPDELKYPLHHLFIKHGKTCPRCRAITGENSEGWEKGCVIDHLVKRVGVRKGTGVAEIKAGRGKKASKPKVKKSGYDESDGESSELSDLGSEGEESETS